MCSKIMLEYLLLTSSSSEPFSSVNEESGPKPCQQKVFTVKFQKWKLCILLHTIVTSLVDWIVRVAKLQNKVCAPIWLTCKFLLASNGWHLLGTFWQTYLQNWGTRKYKMRIQDTMKIITLLNHYIMRQWRLVLVFWSA